MNSKNKLTKQFVDSWFKIQDNLLYRNKQIYERLNYIVLTIGKTFDIDLQDSWHLPGDHREVQFTLNEIANKEFINVVIDYGIENRIVIVDNKEINFFDNDYDYGTGVPTRWLFEDFEQELVDGIEKYNRKENDKKEKYQQRIETIKSKLSPEERELIAFKQPSKDLESPVE